MQPNTVHCTRTGVHQTAVHVRRNLLSKHEQVFTKQPFAVMEHWTPNPNECSPNNRSHAPNTVTEHLSSVIIESFECSPERHTQKVNMG